jgi:hypothetical protein
MDTSPHLRRFIGRTQRCKEHFSVVLMCVVFLSDEREMTKINECFFFTLSLRQEIYICLSLNLFSESFLTASVCVQ